MIHNTINNYIIDYDLALNIGIKVLEEHEIFPIQQQDLFILVATAKKEQNELLLTSLFKTPIKFLYVDNKVIQFQIQNFDIQYEIFLLSNQALNYSMENNTDNSYMFQTTDKIILFAISLNASDIHFESLNDSIVIRFRIFGILYILFTFKLDMYPLFSSILKLFANLDISQNRLPQNGRFSKTFANNKEFDFRISTMPTINGESIVLRILDNQNSKIMLKDIGFDDDAFKVLDKAIHSHQGMILVTGPTGSGKTTTLYSILNTLNTASKKILTIEDPIEYNLAGIQQVNINNDIKLDYEIVLKNILRQDPDVIMIGEIRDEVALKIAIQASLTGHLVLATLHTNNAPETINRLLDLDAKAFLIASTLKAIVSQRLVRKLCDKCKKQNSKPVGCQGCNYSGYTDRIIVSEILKIDEKVSQYIAKGQTIQDIVTYAKTQNYTTIEENTLEKVKSGLTSMEEFYTKVQM